MGSGRGSPHHLPSLHRPADSARCLGRRFAGRLEDLAEATAQRDPEAVRATAVLHGRSDRLTAVGVIEPADRPRLNGDVGAGPMPHASGGERKQRCTREARTRHGPPPVPSKSRHEPTAGPRRVSPSDEPSRLVVVGQGYVGLPLALRAVEVGYRRGRLRRRRRPDQAAGRRQLLRRGRHRRARWPRPSPPAATSPPTTRAGWPDSTWPSSTSPPRCATASPTCPTWRRPPRRWPATCDPGATVILESTSYPGTTEELVGPILEAGSGLVAGRDFHLGLQPRADRSWQPDLEPGEHPEGGLGHRRRLAASRSEASTTRIVDAHGPRVGHPRGRADQAAREHLPPRQHRAGQRAGHVRRGPRHRRLGGHRRRLHQALRLPALHPGPGRRRPLPPHRPQLPLVEGAADPRPALPVRRAGQRRQRAHARLRGPPPPPGASTGMGRPSTAPGSSSSDWPTSGTPATPARRRAPSSPSRWSSLGAEVRVADPHLSTGSVPYPSGGADRRGAGLRRWGRHRDRPRRLRLRPGRNARAPTSSTPGTGSTAPTSSGCSLCPCNYRGGHRRDPAPPGAALATGARRR